MEEFSAVIMKRFSSNWFKKTKGRHVTYNTRQSVLRRKRIFASFVKTKTPKIFEVVYTFLHIPFANKGIDAINISNILNRKEVVKEIPPYLKNQSVPIVSYSYTNSIGRKFFNYKEALQDILRSTINTFFEFVNPTL
jgi:hypothetical protein